MIVKCGNTCETCSHSIHLVVNAFANDLNNIRLKNDMDLITSNMDEEVMMEKTMNVVRIFLSSTFSFFLIKKN